jgi:hypothetical protein
METLSQIGLAGIGIVVLLFGLFIAFGIVSWMIWGLSASFAVLCPEADLSGPSAPERRTSERAARLALVRSRNPWFKPLNR